MSGYQRYLESQQNQGRQEGSGLKEIAMLAAGVTAVGLGVGTSQGRSLIREATVSASGAMTRFSQTNLGGKFQEAGMIFKAMDHGIDMRGPLSHLRNPNRYQSRFQDSLSKSIAERNRTLATPLRGQPTFSENLVYKMQSDLDLFSSEIKRDMRYHQVTDELKGKLPKDLYNTTHGILNQQDDAFFNKAGHAEIEKLIKKYSEPSSKSGSEHVLNFKNSKEKDGFLNTVLSAVKAHQPDHAINQSEFSRIMSDRTKDLYDGLKQNLQPKKNRFFGQELREMTWADAFKRNVLDKDTIRKPAKDQHGNFTGQHEDANIAKMMRDLAKNSPEFNNLVLDPYLLIDKKGNMHDYRSIEKSVYNGLTAVRDRFEVPFLRFNPLDLMHWTTYQSVREAPQSYIFGRGNIDVTLSTTAKTMEKHPLAHNQDAAATPLARSYFYSGDKVKDLLSGEVIKDNVYLGSARFGMLPRVMAGAGNLHQVDTRQANPLKKLFGFGMQEQESVYKRLSSGVTKFADQDWGPNAVGRLYTPEMRAAREMGDNDEVIRVATEVYKKVHSDLDTHVGALSDDVVNVLNGAAQRAYGDIGVDLTKLSTDEEVMGALGRIGYNMKQGLVTDNKNIAGMIHSLTKEYAQNPLGFVNEKRILSEASPVLAGMSDLFDVSQTQLITNVEDARRLIHQHALQQIESNGDITVGALIKDAVQQGSLKGGAYDEVADLQALSKVRGYWSDIYQGSELSSEMAAKNFAEDMWKTEGGILNKDALSIAESVNRHNSPWSLGPGDKPPQYFGRVGYLAVNKAKGGRHALEQYNKMVSEGVNPMKAGVKSALEIISQPFAGRNNIDNMTTATMPSYYFAERLDNALSRINLGLPQNMRGSMQSILGNQFGRRLVLPYVGIQQAMYFDGLTGDTISDGLADGYANMHEDTAFFKGVFGLNRIGKYFGSLTPGGELFWGTPVGSVLKHGTFGFLGDTRSAEEVHEYYESGEDPIRKGRFWGIGSNTPWQGGKIDHYEANWYRRLKSDYKFTDTMYGDEKEYWANHWMPTLTNPLAPLRHFLTDSDHYENKHEKDRPYAITGGFAELDMVPIIGPAINNTVGRILKPRDKNPGLERAHRKYLEDINNNYTSRYESALGGGYLRTMPAGGYEIISNSGSYGIPGNAGVSTGTGTGTGTGGGTDGGMGSSVAMGNLKSINEGIAAQGASPAPSLSSLDGLRNPDIQADLMSVGNSSGLASTTERMYYSMSEMAGIYGFGLNTLIGHNEANRTLTLDPSSRMMSYSRAWWDLELGGLGGDLSEIGRRYNPRDKGNYYNPMENEMPNWLPGSEYFVDFQHGDPYTKVKKGEIRLPGKAYETLNQLHPDEFGKLIAELK